VLSLLHNNAPMKGQVEGLGVIGMCCSSIEQVGRPCRWLDYVTLGDVLRLFVVLMRHCVCLLVGYGIWVDWVA